MKQCVWGGMIDRMMRVKYVLVRNGKKKKENWSKEGAGEAIEIERNLRQGEKRREDDEKEKIEKDKKVTMDKWNEIKGGTYKNTEKHL